MGDGVVQKQTIMERCVPINPSLNLIAIGRILAMLSLFVFEFALMQIDNWELADGPGWLDTHTSEKGKANKHDSKDPLRQPSQSMLQLSHLSVPVVKREKLGQGQDLVALYRLSKHGSFNQNPLGGDFCRRPVCKWSRIWASGGMIGREPHARSKQTPDALAQGSFRFLRSPQAAKKTGQLTRSSSKRSIGCSRHTAGLQP